MLPKKLDIKKAASAAKDTAKTIVKVPQVIGRTILSVPDAVLRKRRKDGSTDSQEQNHEFASKLEFINREIIEEQGRRTIVRESKQEMMKDVSNHLKTYLLEHPNAVYEEWVADIHPDNAEYEDGRIDHRFYVEQSDHRQIWNQFMKELNFIERIVISKSVQPSYDRKHEG